MTHLTDFLSELKRRRVFRVAVVYAGVAFVIIQLADYAFEQFNVSSEFGRFLMIVLALGFLIVIALAWAFDITDKGIVRAKGRPADAKRKSQPLLGNKSLAVIAVLAIIVAIWALLRGPSPGEATISSVAVLPLENLMGDPKQEYYVDGMHDALTGEMSRISALRVIGRTSTMSYKGNLKPIPEIAEELNVDAVVEGSVLRFPDGETIRIIAQLVTARPERQIFYEVYEGGLTDILFIHKTIVADIAAAIGLTLTPEEEDYLASAPKVNPEAYDQYQWGWYYRNQENPESIQRAMEYLERSVELDSTFALAWANLCVIYGIAKVQYGLIDRTEAVYKARNAVEKALALDPELAQAHISKGILISYTDVENMTTTARVAEAEAAFQRGIALNPGLLDAHYEYGMFLWRRGRYNEAIPRFLKAREISPVSFHAYMGLGLSYLCMGQLEQAYDYIQKAHDLEPAAAPIATYLAAVRVALLHKQGRYEELLTEVQVSGDPVALMIAYRGLDEPDLAAALFDSLRTSYQLEGRSRLELAYLHAVYGDHESALTLLEEIPVLGSFPIWQYHFRLWELYDNPRYQALVAQTGLQY